MTKFDWERIGYDSWTCEHKGVHIIAERPIKTWPPGVRPYYVLKTYIPDEVMYFPEEWGVDLEEIEVIVKQIFGD